MKLVISAKSSAFEFNGDVKSVENAVSKIVSVLAAAGAGSDKFFGINSNGTALVIFGYTPDTFAACTVVTDGVVGSGTFGFDPTMLLGVIKGRGGMNFKFTGNDIEFKALKSKYTGKLVTLPITADCVSHVNDLAAAKTKGSIEIDPAVLDCIKEGIERTAVKDVYAGSPLLTYITLAPKAITVFSFDNHHFAFYRAKATPGASAQVAATAATFALIDKMFEGTKAALTLRPESIRFEGSKFLMIVPTVQANEKDFTLVPDYITSIKDYSFQCAFSNTKFMSLAENMITLYSSNAMIELSSGDGKKLNVAFQTQNGSASDSLVVKAVKGTKFKCKIDPRILKDSFGLIGDVSEEPILGLVADKMLTAKAVLKSGAALTIVNSITA